MWNAATRKGYGFFIPRYFYVIKMTDLQIALQKHFRAKRDHVLKRLEDMGLKVDIPPTSTFYIWLNLDHLPAPLDNGLVSKWASFFFSFNKNFPRRSSKNF